MPYIVTLRTTERAEIQIPEQAGLQRLTGGVTDRVVRVPVQTGGVLGLGDGVGQSGVGEGGAQVGSAVLGVVRARLQFLHGGSGDRPHTLGCELVHGGRHTLDEGPLDRGGDGVHGRLQILGPGDTGAEGHESGGARGEDDRSGGHALGLGHGFPS